MHIHHATAADSALLAPIFHEMYRYYFAEAPTQAEVEHYLREQVLPAHSGVQCFVAIDAAGAPLAFATVSILYPAPRLGGQAYMKDLFVGDAARGLGLGRQLMQAVAAYALSRDCQRLDWSAEHSNPPAVAFYDKIGAKPLADKIYYRISGEELQDFACDQVPQKVR